MKKGYGEKAMCIIIMVVVIKVKGRVISIIICPTCKKYSYNNSLMI